MRCASLLDGPGLRSGALTNVPPPRSTMLRSDPSSIEAFKDDPESKAFLNDKKDLYENTAKLSDFKGKANEFAAIVAVGGHGPIFERDSETGLALYAEFFDAGKVVSAVCHAPIVLAAVKLSNGEYLVDGQEVTGFSNSEEVSLLQTVWSRRRLTSHSRLRMP